MQQELVAGNEQTNEIYNKTGFLKTINLVIEKAIKTKIEVIFVSDKDVAGEEGTGFQILSDLNVLLKQKSLLICY